MILGWVLLNATSRVPHKLDLLTVKENSVTITTSPPICLSPVNWTPYQKHLHHESLSISYLFMRINIDVALDAFLSHVGPTVPRHPLSFAFGALVLTKTPFFPLIRSQTLSFRTCLKHKKILQKFPMVPKVF